MFAFCRGQRYSSTMPVKPIKPVKSLKALETQAHSIEGCLPALSKSVLNAAHSHVMRYVFEFAGALCIAAIMASCKTVNAKHCKIVLTIAPAAVAAQGGGAIGIPFVGPGTLAYGAPGVVPVATAAGTIQFDSGVLRQAHMVNANAGFLASGGSGGSGGAGPSATDVCVKLMHGMVKAEIAHVIKDFKLKATKGAMDAAVDHVLAQARAFLDALAAKKKPTVATVGRLAKVHLKSFA